MRKKWLLSMIAVLSIVILAACSDDANEASQSEPEEEQSENSQDDNDESAEANDEEDQDTKAASEIGLDDLSPIPTDVEGLAQQTSGPFAGDESIYDLEQEVKEEFEQLGPMSDNPTDEEYETYL
ncbi:hypothetical protein [Lentibacillus salicampi]|uniref:Uncharacterized protein n=1 Tax=Lentibacillus salicampi TaxID=175306 RepID=A0A4Y9AA48_9BACI|nr:hypothetical protein [Lentibacillus salicampi]TFJ92769.1 hypothetical protein E4U82_10215 [Lentibacillus salicampi]